MRSPHLNALEQKQKQEQAARGSADRIVANDGAIWSAAVVVTCIILAGCILAAAIIVRVLA